MKEIYQYNTDQIIRGLCYSSSILCSSPESLIKHIQNISSIANISDQEYLEKLNKILKYINKQSNRKLIDQDRALQLLLKNDIETILNLELENHDNPEEQLNKYFQKFQKIIKDLGLSVKVKIFIVDRYPKPYDKQTKGNAMQCDKDDEINFKINSGIYFRRQQLSPYISIFVLAHEIAHSFFNHKNDNRLARGLEEGIADIFAIYLCSKVMKYDILRNILINMRTMFSYDQFRYRYLDSLRQATVFYQKFGMVGIVDILKSGKTVGRYLLKDIEEKILRDKWGEIKLQCKKTRNIKKVDNILRFFLSYPNSSVVSPLALHVATKVDVNLKISTILRQNKIHNQQGINAINELQSILMLISYNNKIFYNELQSYLQSKTIKYKI